MPPSTRGTRESQRMYVRRIPSLVAIYILFACHIIGFAPFLDAIMPGTLLGARWIIVSIVLAFCIVSLLYGTISRSLLLFAFVMATLISAQLLYSFNFGQPAALGALAPYLAFGAVVIFSETRVSIQDIAKAAFRVSVIYLFLYAAFHDYFLSLMYISTDYINTEGPGRRLTLPLSYVVFSVAYAISTMSVSRRSWPFLGAVLVLALYCLWLANSRAFNLLFTIGIIIALVAPLRRRLRLLLGGVTIAIMAFTCLMVPTSINPFGALDYDTSGHFRVIEYEMAREILREHPIAGLGIQSSLKRDSAIFVRDPDGANPWDIITLYPGDIGAVGLWLSFGLHGLLLTLYGTWLCFSFRTSARVPARIAETLRTTGSVIGTYGIIAPTIFGGSGTMLFALIVATHLNARARSRADAPTIPPTLTAVTPGQPT